MPTMPDPRLPQATAHSIHAQAPCRVDLAGGTLDLWPLYLFHEGAVTVNVAISVMTSCRITPVAGSSITLKSADTAVEHTYGDFDELLSSRDHRHALAAHLVREFAPRPGAAGMPPVGMAGWKGGFVMETHSESPAGAGISGSSALMVSTTAALAQFTGRKLDREQIRELAQNVEAQLIRVPTGCQDYYPALYGGVSAIHLTPGGIRREALPVPPAEIHDRFVLGYTGAPRQSGINNWEVFKAHINGDRRVFRNFEEIAQIARAMRAALIAHDWKNVARLLKEEWKLRRSNAPGITTPLIDQMVAKTARAGARAAKVCGAGGGGCVIFLVEPDARERVAEVITDLGARVLPFRVDRKGLTITKPQ
ncbi:MAG TPA: hypothetical protein VE998_02385 [Terriglobales bacterium]|nr:hypothetical protein [Terriglobales bacterium]